MRDNILDIDAYVEAQRDREKCGETDHTYKKKLDETVCGVCDTCAYKGPHYTDYEAKKYIDVCEEFGHVIIPMEKCPYYSSTGLPF